MQHPFTPLAKLAQAFLFTALLTIALSSKATAQEQMPKFKGDLMEFLTKNLHYPDSARKLGIEGKSKVQFIVMEDGKLSGVQLAMSSGNDYLDAEALRVVNLMRSVAYWQPGMLYGKPVEVYFTLPVTFKLN